MIGIYKIVNTINSKVYIGQSKNISKRWVAHRSRAFNNNALDFDKPLYRAIRKHGLDNFTFSILEETKLEDLDNREKYWINFYNATNPEYGYNLSSGGQGSAVAKVLKKEEIGQIQKMLLETKKTQEEIAKQFNVSQRMVSAINLGESWINENYQYPIRTESVLKHNNLCQRCGQQISRGAIYCRECKNFLERKVQVRPSREVLKEQIRNNSFLSIGRTYNVSDTTIRKWCKGYNLPTTKKEIKTLTEQQWEEI